MGYRVEETIEADSKASAADVVATRVNGESIEMLSPEVVPISEWAAFELRLSTGDVFLEGMGRCEACAASGSGHRVRLGTLQFDVMNELMFERIQIAAESMVSGERTGEVDIAALEAMRKAERSPQPSPSVAAASLPKPPTPMNTPSWRPPPPLRARTAAPAPVQPAAAQPDPPQPPVQPKPAPPPPAPIAVEPIAPVATQAQFTPSGFPPPLPKPAPTPPPSVSPPAEVKSEPAAPEPVPELAAPAVPKDVSTVSGFPAPPAEPSKPKLGAFASEPRYSSIPPKKSAEPEGEPTTRERLEPLILAMRRAGAARHVEDAEEMALELGLQTLEAIFGE